MTSPPQYPPPPEPPQNFTGMPQYSGGYAATPPGKGMAVAGLVCGIVAVALFFLPPVAIILGILGIVFGAIGMSRAKRGRGTGKGMAIAGLVLGVIGIIISAAIIAVAVKQAKDCEDAIGHKPTSSELRQCIRDGV